MAQPGIREGLSLLRQPDFAKGFFAYLVSFTGSAMAPIAMAFGVLELTGSTRDSAIVIAAPIVAQVLVLLFGGTLADRGSRQRQLVLSDLLAMFAQLSLAYLFLSGKATIPLLTLFMLVNGIAVGFNSPAATGFIPQIVKREELQAANALLSMARHSAVTVGAVIAGVMVALLGAGVTLIIDGISFGISALLIASMRPKAQTVTAAASFLQDLRLGWNEFSRHTWLWVIVVQFSLVVAAMEAVWGLLGPAVARAELGGAVTWGFVAASMGAGTIAGTLVAMKLVVPRPMLFASFMVFFFALVPLSLAASLPVWMICIGASIGGLTGQLFGVLWYSTLQKVIPDHLLSRVSAFDHLGSVALAPLGIVVGGILFEILGPTETLLIAAAAIIVPTLLVLCVRDVRDLRVTEPL